MKKIIMVSLGLILMSLHAMEDSANLLLHEKEKLFVIINEEYKPFYDAEVARIKQEKPADYDPGIESNPWMMQQDIAERSAFINLVREFNVEHTKIQNIFEQAAHASSIKDLHSQVKKLDDFYKSRCLKHVEDSKTRHDGVELLTGNNHYIRMSRHISQLLAPLQQ